MAAASQGEVCPSASKESALELCGGIPSAVDIQVLCSLLSSDLLSIETIAEHIGIPCNAFSI